MCIRDRRTARRATRPFSSPRARADAAEASARAKRERARRAGAARAVAKGGGDDDDALDDLGPRLVGELDAETAAVMLSARARDGGLVRALLVRSPWERLARAYATAFAAHAGSAAYYAAVAQLLDAPRGSRTLALENGEEVDVVMPPPCSDALGSGKDARDRARAPRALTRGGDGGDGLSLIHI